MTSYTIRPTATGFGIFKGRTMFGRPKQVANRERLYDAEMYTLSLVAQDYHRELDYTRLTHQTMSTDMMNPRTSEEHIYVALSLAGKKPPGADDQDEFRPMLRDTEEFKKFDNILGTHLGFPISYIARMMFEERFMTWYGQQNPNWIDPRREREFRTIKL